MWKYRSTFWRWSAITAALSEGAVHGFVRPPLAQVAGGKGLKGVTRDRDGEGE